MRGLLLGLLVLCGCSLADTPKTTRQQQPQLSEAAGGQGDFERLLPWGAGTAEVGLWPAAVDRQAYGPSAVAVGPQGAVFVLDQINGRVLQLSAATLRLAARVPQHAATLALSATGELAIYSPLMHQVQIFSQGEPVGQVAVPKVFRQVSGVILEPTRSVLLQLAQQALFRLGSPALPQSLATVLHSEREGAFLLKNGQGVAVHLTARGQPEVQILDQGEHHPVVRSYRLSEQVLAARVIGVAGDIICLRLEQALLGGPAFRVQRRALCLRGSSGEVIERRDLPAPGLYQPRQELALGGSPLRLALISPTEAGLLIRSWPVAVDEVHP